MHVGRRDCNAPAAAMPVLHAPHSAQPEAKFVTQ
jgi:hypothetical protein